ncbi:MAG: methyltransferase [Bacteroidetes bacterium]|nr:MAG: methyltransferase [Bacteroidota bacterium]
MADFDKKAATWDDDPERVNRALSIADSISKHIDLSRIEKAMEYGSGTGLLSFALKDRLASIALMDESASMIEVVKDKCAANNVNHFVPLQYNILKQPLPDQKYDFIFILLTLHHIIELEEVLDKFARLLNPRGYLAIIDLEKEDGTFHPEGFNGHNGFDRETLESQLQEADITPISYEVCYELKRDYDDVDQKYPLFLLISQKQG